MKLLSFKDLSCLHILVKVIPIIKRSKIPIVEVIQISRCSVICKHVTLTVQILQKRTIIQNIDSWKSIEFLIETNLVSCNITG